MFIPLEFTFLETRNILPEEEDSAVNYQPIYADSDGEDQIIQKILQTVTISLAKYVNQTFFFINLNTITSLK
jgi:hypothetical protein